jgi:methyl-accepting chemotaxis protein
MDSVKKSENGTELVKKTKEVFSDVVTQVQKVTDLVNEIATASEDQTNGIEQVNKAIQQMNQVVQQNAANSEETAAASEELATQAQALNHLVNKVGAEVGMDNKGEDIESISMEKKGTAHRNKGASYIVKKKLKDRSSNKPSSEIQDDTLSEGNGKGIIMANNITNRLISPSSDEFKDF